MKASIGLHFLTCIINIFNSAELLYIYKISFKFFYKTKKFSVFFFFKFYLIFKRKYIVDIGITPNIMFNIGRVLKPKMFLSRSLNTTSGGKLDIAIKMKLKISNELTVISCKANEFSFFTNFLSIDELIFGLALDFGTVESSVLCVLGIVGFTFG